ncbi:hypothetical protein [Thermodesulfovibrio yellowstonii]|uniref:Uncharacterized protein n=1 Tax=Thermodesulfovibrio yellowstonii TaxID=28262 RepID=A0A9W6GGZ9_9BACT|nr:hypothetical protein [Thermodesulfovibrio islandicus]GLI53965.1 hypothetical protein TISLANDTSLP1_16580 [Thermodesulfovibrio islandicus]
MRKTYLIFLLLFIFISCESYAFTLSDHSISNMHNILTQMQNEQKFIDGIKNFVSSCNARAIGPLGAAEQRGCLAALQELLQRNIGSDFQVNPGPGSGYLPGVYYENKEPFGKYYVYFSGWKLTHIVFVFKNGINAEWYLSEPLIIITKNSQTHDYISLGIDLNTNKASIIDAKLPQLEIRLTRSNTKEKQKGISESKQVLSQDFTSSKQKTESSTFRKQDNSVYTRNVLVNYLDSYLQDQELQFPVINDLLLGNLDQFISFVQQKQNQTNAKKKGGKR